MYQSIKCCGCKAVVRARLTDGGEIYPHRPDLAPKQFWKCDTCKNYVGCHPSNDRKKTPVPLGCIPTPEIRKARNHIHALIDPLWKSGRIKRTAMYAKMSEALGYVYHSDEISDIEEARNVYRKAKAIHNELTIGNCNG